MDSQIIRTLKEQISACSNSEFIVINDYWLAEEGFINHEILDIDFIKTHLDDFRKTYELLEDDLSRDTMMEYLYAFAGKDASELAKLASDHEHDYDLQLLFDGRNNGVVIECGAFDGESIVQMSDFTDNSFDMIALECDEVNYKKCRETVKQYPNIRVLKLGVWDKKTQLALVMSDSSSYHKKEDLITIPQFINCINGNYKFYIRYNKGASLCRTGDETTLYAIMK